MKTTYVLLASALLYGAFCRLTLTGRATWWAVRAAFAAMGAVMIFAVLEVVVWAYEPAAIDVAVLAVFAVVQLVSVRLWRHGVPGEYTRPHRKAEEPAARRGA